MKTLFSAVAAIIFSLGSIGAATVDLDGRSASTMATQFTAVSTTLEG